VWRTCYRAALRAAAGRRRVPVALLDFPSGAGNMLLASVWAATSVELEEQGAQCRVGTGNGGGSPARHRGHGHRPSGLREFVIELDNGDSDVFRPDVGKISSPTSCT
jgi:hypothetical protein